MEQETENTVKQYAMPIAIVVAAAILAGAWVYGAQNAGKLPAGASLQAVAQEDVLPAAGVILPVSWGMMGKKLTDAGAIDKARFETLYKERGQFTDEYKKLLEDNSTGKLKITADNAGYLLNLLWALGLANKNPVLETGEMMDKAYGGAGNFASTGGWTMAMGDAMDHYSRHALIELSPAQQALVEKVSKNIYRPCCGNSTHFPDCNHGMAMLGLLELMASQGVGEEEMYKAALAVNSYWFPDTYMTIAAYMQGKGVAWSDVSPKEMLGAAYSSASGYANIAAKVTTPAGSGGGGCGV